MGGKGSGLHGQIFVTICPETSQFHNIPRPGHG